ncbi:MAG: DNA-protecting protein DprA [Acidobacteria bacterium]|nr:DNA-protecting protein DprA [Acidobacteriota bacterium]
MCHLPLTRHFVAGYSPRKDRREVSVAQTSSLPSLETSTLQWLALALTPGLGPTRARRLTERFGSIRAVFAATLTELEAAGLQAVSAQALGTGRSLELAQDELVRAVAGGAHVVSLEDPAYPSRLKEIYDPPIVLYVRGSVDALAQPGIAVVGTRHPTPYGIGMAERLGCDLAARGLMIFSGLARGVDAAAHRGAVNAKGKTVAVFGTGVDVVYPKEHTRLVDQILSLGGAVISEFPLSTFAAPQNFPIRNRIISGISAGVLVVEAAEYSGTRITSRCALEQNREVFAVPGNVTNKNAWGPNTLIKQGAKLVATWEDIWEELPADVRLTLEPPQPLESSRQETASLFADEESRLGPHERKILALLKADEATQIDEIVEQLEPQLSSSEIFAALFELELAGKVRQLPGKNFVKSF